MTPSDASRLADEFRRGHGLDESARTAGKAFEQWKVTQAADEPLEDILVLAWLLDHPKWRWSTARNAALALDRYYRLTRDTSVIGPPVTAYLARLGKTARSPLPLVEALRGPDVNAVSQRLQDLDREPDDVPVIIAMRDGLAALRLSAAPETPLEDAFRDLSLLRVEQTGDSFALVAGTGAVIDHLESSRAEAWKAHLPLLKCRTTLRQRAKRAAERSGIHLNSPVGEITDEQWEWLWRMLDGSTPRRLRDHAYLLLGFEHARRHAELARLNIEDVTATPDGYSVDYRRTKNGDDFHGTLTHVRQGSGCCAYCPACALGDLLRWEEVCMKRTTGPLLATRYGGTVRRMTRQNARLRIQHLTALVSDEPWGSTRSLRTGAATTAWEAGWSVQMIAQHLTGHRDIDQADLYIRRHGAPGGTLQLRLVPPSR